MKACFVHRGFSPFLRLAVRHAVRAGLDPVIIGDAAARCEGAEFCDIADLSGGAQSFTAVYTHRSVNDEHYELFCFERWFLLREYMRGSNESIWVLDHDVMAFSGLLDLGLYIEWSCGQGPIMSNSAWSCFIRNEASVGLLTDYFMSVYCNPAALDRLSLKYAINGVPHLSDMVLLDEFAATAQEGFLDLANRGVIIGVDNNIRASGGILLANDHKDIFFEGYIPYGKLEGGGRRQMRSLHFQGPSKFLMPFYSDMGEGITPTFLSDCTRAIKNPPDDDVGRSIRAQFAKLREEAG